MQYPSSARVAGPKLPIGQAVALGGLHGAAELLPISSSGHVGAIPWLLRWDYAELSPEDRKSFEVAVHAGALVATLVGQRRELAEDLRSLTRRAFAVAALASASPAVVGLLLERQIEHRLGSPPSIAVGLVGGAVAMALADRCAEDRVRPDAEARDGLWLGFAQACALLPGVSRSAATIAAARFLRFNRADAERLSRQLGLPVITGAAMLRATRLLRHRPGRELAAALAAGAGASFASALLSSSLMPGCGRNRSLLPYALYRVTLATTIFTRLARAPRARRRGPARA